MITVIGAGVLEEDLSLRALSAIEAADLIVVQSEKTDFYRFFKSKAACPLRTLDALYEQCSDFTQLNQATAERFVELSAEFEKICYVVGGSGTEDATVEAVGRVLPLEVIAGVSYADYAFCKAGLSGAKSAISATDFLANADYDWDRDTALVIYGADDRLLTSEIKLKLSQTAGDDTRTIFVGMSGTTEPSISEIDRLPETEYGYRACLVVPAQPFEAREKYNFGDLVRIMHRLRAKDGCPWDRAQTHESIRQNLIEEAYELIDAIDREDISNIEEECGDVILQGVFHACIAEDAGDFTLADVLSELCRKLIRRHTHIFGTVEAADATEALAAWNAAKAVEKNQKTPADKLRALANALPGLLKVGKLMKYAGEPQGTKADADRRIADIMRKQNWSEDDAGELLFYAALKSELAGINPETALNREISRRIEAAVAQTNEN